MWAERYVRRVDDLFVVMDEITELIVGAIGTTYGGRLRRAAGQKLRLRPLGRWLKGVLKLRSTAAVVPLYGIGAFGSPGRPIQCLS